MCDVGGGTSDFTLIRVRRGEGGKVQFHRVAVGEHLILGGDNLDLALAHHLEQRLTGGGRSGAAAMGRAGANLPARERDAAGPRRSDRLTVSLPGSGSRLIGGGLQVEVTRDEVREVLVDGFFPRVDLGRKAGRPAVGLPGVRPPLCPRPGHNPLPGGVSAGAPACGLGRPAAPAPGGQAEHDPARPDVVLFNGGVFESRPTARPAAGGAHSWFRTPQQPDWQPLVLDNDRLDLAVARGAAYYGMVRRGQGVRIAAGLARTYYIGVEQSEPPAAVCLVPAGVEPGEDMELRQHAFKLLVSQPVEFPLFVSSTRLTDRPGELVTVDREQMTPLPPIRTVLRTAKKGESGTMAVHLHARLTEIGTLDLWCSQVDGPRSWRLQFDVRSATQTDLAAHESQAEARRLHRRGGAGTPAAG